MDSPIARQYADEGPDTPEEQELAEKLAVIQHLEEELEATERQIAELEVTVQSFWLLYSRRVGALYVKIDAVEADIVMLQLQRDPQNAKLQRESSTAFEKAETSSRIALQNVDVAPEASVGIRSLFRQAALKFHPDLAQSLKDDARCGDFMTKANAAYEIGDAEELRRLIQAWDAAPDSIEGSDVGSRLIRAIRTIASLRRKRAELESKRKEIEQGDVYLLYHRLVGDVERGLRRLEDDARASLRNAEVRLERLKSHAE